MRKLILLFIFFPLLVFAGQLSSYGPTSKTDQLWQIAILARPTAQISIQQAMVAIFKANPDAFVADSMYKLKSNVTLQIPAQDVMQNVNADQAVKMVEQQEQILYKKQTKKTVHSKQRHGLTKTIESNTSAIAGVNKQYSNVGKVLISFDQQYQVRLADLEQHNLALQNQIDQLQQQTASLQVRLDVQAQHAKQSASFFAPYIAIVDKTFGVTGSKILVISAAAFLLILLLWLRLRRRHECSCGKKVTESVKQEHDDDEDTESEYDFLGSEEGIPAKLDLARAYIDMGDVKAAQEILREIAKHGNSEQKEEAKQLLQSVR